MELRRPRRVSIVLPGEGAAAPTDRVIAVLIAIVPISIRLVHPCDEFIGRKKAQKKPSSFAPFVPLFGYSGLAAFGLPASGGWRPCAAR